MKKKLKILFISLIIITLSSINVVYAGTSIIGEGKNWISQGKTEQNRFDIDRTKFNDLVGILWEFGLFAVLVVGVVVGIKFMISSAEEKASIKTSMMPYLIGSGIILGALTIWKIVVEFTEGII